MLEELISANVDLYIDQGDTFYKKITVKDDTGAIIDLTGLTVECSMNKYFQSQKDYGLVGSIISPTLGTIALTMTETKSRALTGSRYVYSVRLRSNTMTVKIMEGQVMVMNTALGQQIINLNIAGVGASGAAG